MNKNVENFIFGIKPNGEYRDTLSWSGYSLWKSSKDSYRKRYYENQKPFETAETIFGKKIAEMLEQDETVIGSETPIEITLKNGLKLVSFLDSFDEKTHSIVEYKTGHLSKDGKCPWSKIKVAKHKQLDWYSMMVKKKYGKVNPVVTLIWLETAFKQKSVTFLGHTLTDQSRELELTGKKEIFKRRIPQWQRDMLEKDIIKTSKEITKDFIAYEKNTPRSN